MNKPVVLGAIAFSFLPIWRAAGGQPGMNFWQYANIAFLRSPGSYPHLTIEEAITRARMAYSEVTGFEYETVYDSNISGRRIGSDVPSGIG